METVKKVMYDFARLFSIGWFSYLFYSPIKENNFVLLVIVSVIVLCLFFHYTYLTISTYQKVNILLQNLLFSIFIFCSLGYSIVLSSSVLLYYLSKIIENHVEFNSKLKDSNTMKLKIIALVMNSIYLAILIINIIDYSY